MRLPDNIFRQSHAARYGGGAFELIVGYDEPGCPRAYFLRYEDGTRPEEPEVPRMRGTAVHEALALMEAEQISPDEALARVWPAQLGPTTYMESIGIILDYLERPDDGTHTVASELELTAPLYDDEDFGPIMLGGRIDRLAMVMDDPRLLIFVDYKTDAAPPAKADVERWIQGYWYAELVRANAHRWIGSATPKIKGVYAALRWYDLPRDYTWEELGMFRAWAESVARRILRDEDPVPILNPGCGRCDYRHDCPAWLDLPGDGISLLERIRNTRLEDQMALRPAANETKNKLEKFTHDIDALARSRLKVGDSLDVGELSVARVPREQDQITDLRLVHELMGDEFYQRASMSKSTLEEYGKEVPEARGKIRQLLKKRVVGDALKWGKKK